MIGRALNTLPNPIRQIVFVPSGITMLPNYLTYEPPGLRRPRFRLADHFVHFTYGFWRHIKNHGLDTIFYVPSMVNPKEVVNVILQYDQVTISHVKEESKKLAVH